jgi:hypothetical protein
MSLVSWKQVGWKQVGWKALGWKDSNQTGDFPADLALLWPVRPSLTGAQKSAVGPAPEWSYTGAQYDADGVSVGAVPAWHTGKGVWCGPAYTQMLTNSKFIGAVSGTPGTAPTGWTNAQNAGTLSIQGEALTFSCAAQRRAISISISCLANTVYRLDFDAECDGVAQLQHIFFAFSRPAGTAFAFEIDGVTAAATSVPLAGKRKIKYILTMGSTAGSPSFQFGLGVNSADVTGTVTISRPMLTTLINAPYVASDTTGPVTVPSAAGTSGGNGLAWAKTTKLGAIYDGQGTVACKVTLGAASSAVTADTNILTVDDTAVGLIYAAASNTLKSNDGTNTATVSCTWAANDELLIAVELLASTFRIGFAKTADSAITWGTAATYDGSHNSGTKLRLALLNAIPMWADGVYVSSKTGLTAADIRRYI